MAMSSLGEANKVVQLSSAANDFITCAKTLMATNGRRAEAFAIATESRLSPRVAHVLKTAAESGSTVNADWEALAEYRLMTDGFVTSLAAFGCFDRILADNNFRRTPLRTRIAIASTAPQGSSISELAAKPISSMTFGLATLEPRKVVSYVVISNELARTAAPGAVAMFGNELRRACAVATDLVFLTAISETTSVASNASTGLTAAAFLSDLDTALQAISIGANSRLYLVLPPNVAKTVALLRGDGGLLFPQMTVTGGTIQGIKVVLSDAATDTAVLLDAAQVAAESDAITLDVAEHASLQMDDEPTDGSVSLVSLWQNNLRGLRAERAFGCELLRSNAAASITRIQVSA